MQANISSDKLEMPPDLDGCQALIRELVELVERQGADISLLKQRLHGLLREKFGRSSEKLSPGQLQLFVRELSKIVDGKDAVESTGTSPDTEAAETSSEKPTPARSKNGGGGRKPIPAHLTRIPKDYHPAEEELICATCNGKKTEFGITIVEQLDYVPACFRVIEHRTHKYSCKACQEGVVEGERPEQIHNGGKPTEGLIAQISTAKYADHQPLYRQEEIYARQGVDVPRSSMGRWLDVSAESAEPLYDRMHEILLESEVIQADESPVVLLDKNRSPKKSKNGYVWAYYGDNQHPYVLYDFQPDRTAERPKKFLGGYDNLLLTDGYGGYDWFDSKRSANCLVHLRRKVEQSLNYDKKKAGMVLALFNELYKIEGQLRESTADAEQILAIRQSKSLTILTHMKELFVEWQSKTPPKTALGIAINYALVRWEKLCRFTQHACLRPDTNLVESSIRPIALGRKNWMHIGAETALGTASIHASLVNTCKRLGLNPYLYLRDIFIRLGRKDVCIDELLPDRWKLENPIDDFG